MAFDKNQRAAWDKRERQNLLLKLHKTIDADILLRLSGKNKSGYIKSLIRADIDNDQIVKSHCYKCGEKSQATITINKHDQNTAPLTLPICLHCFNKTFGGLEYGKEEN